MQVLANIIRPFLAAMANRNFHHKNGGLRMPLPQVFTGAKYSNAQFKLLERTVEITVDVDFP